MELWCPSTPARQAHFCSLGPHRACTTSFRASHPSLWPSFIYVHPPCFAAAPLQVGLRAEPSVSGWQASCRPSRGAGHSRSNHPKGSKCPRGNNGSELQGYIPGAKAAAVDSLPVVGKHMSPHSPSSVCRRKVGLRSGTGRFYDGGGWPACGQDLRPQEAVTSLTAPWGASRPGLHPPLLGPFLCGLDHNPDSRLPQVVERPLFGFCVQREKWLPGLCQHPVPSVPCQRRNETPLPPKDVLELEGAVLISLPQIS